MIFQILLISHIEMLRVLFDWNLSFAVQGTRREVDEKY